MTKQERMQEAWKILHADMKKRNLKDVDVGISTPEYDKEFDRLQKIQDSKKVDNICGYSVRDGFGRPFFLGLYSSGMSDRRLKLKD